MTVRVHIDRLVVDAAISADPAALEAGIVAALGQALSGPRPDWWHGTAHVGLIRTTLPPGSEPGARVAAAIHEGLAAIPQDRAR